MQIKPSTHPNLYELCEKAVHKHLDEWQNVSGWLNRITGEIEMSSPSSKMITEDWVPFVDIPVLDELSKRWLVIAPWTGNPLCFHVINIHPFTEVEYKKFIAYRIMNELRK